MEKMFIAMNRFKIVIEKGEEFEQIWKNRTSSLKDVPGFIEFHLVKGDTNDEHTLYASHTIWKTKRDFHKWTKSEAFKEAHKNAGKHGHLYLGPPNFEGFEVVL
tara:strand:- start:214 stop:525 length:312 start_codon:yes stop_codon:yes gene_type:complete